MSAPSISAASRAPGVGVPLAGSRPRAGRLLVAVASALFVVVGLVQLLDRSGVLGRGLATWRPTLYAYIIWGVALCVGQVMIRGEQGQQALFVLPAVLFTADAGDALRRTGTAGCLQRLEPQRLRRAAVQRLRQHTGDVPRLVLLERDVEHGAVHGSRAHRVRHRLQSGAAAGADIRGRKLFEVAFLLPLMLTPVAVSWMIGKSLMGIGSGRWRASPAGSARRSPTFFATPAIAKLGIMTIDAWTFIPFMMIMLLAGLQALPREIMEAARVDGANAWQMFWKVIFPLMLPVGLTTIVLRIIFKLKLADIVINVTAGGPGGATDTVTSFIFREYRDRSNVGYGTMLAMVYLVIIIVFVTLLINLASRHMRRVT